MFDTKKFGAYLAAKRKYMGMKQYDLAKKVNLTRQSISKYETGESFPDISIIIQFADIFEITIDELIKSGIPP
jgi:transcriptional regulator with XRE-family HTH domain